MLFDDLVFFLIGYAGGDGSVRAAAWSDLGVLAALSVLVAVVVVLPLARWRRKLLSRPRPVSRVDVWALAQPGPRLALKFWVVLGPLLTLLYAGLGMWAAARAHHPVVAQMLVGAALGLAESAAGAFGMAGLIRHGARRRVSRAGRVAG